MRERNGETSTKYEMIENSPPPTSMEEPKGKIYTTGVPGKAVGHRKLMRKNSRPKSLGLRDSTSGNIDVRNRKISMKDIKQILPTFLILLFTLVVSLTVIPYAFSTVISQLKAVEELEAWQAMKAMNNSNCSSTNEES
ncbi:uncharacterized protein LOC111710113 [Eurytemora carolleeae]|uniref:uncharacterized protein LOC111710113 n=1 Tax=Eurytemora carolleeae TaxID=1294199 RepID=UPI000C781F8B|nr:uncharacterized protein LOC111710113 [Eurytemora carolleeae]|eukprot:XP_023339910.1 uncharacterized protein LOC111710113 [Eurytemora affinis]